MSNSDTLAPARKTATARPAKSAPAAASETCNWRDASIAARDAIAALVFKARDVDENERDDSSGMAKRLMALVVADLGETDTDAAKDEFEAAFFNAEALIHGALNIPADRLGPKVEANLRHALVIIDKMTDHLCGIEAHRVFEVIGAAPAEVQPKHDPLFGYTRRQLCSTFEEIATRADTLGHCLREIRERALSGERHDLYCSIDMASTMADLLGMLADTPTQGAIKGDAMTWLLGPNFANEGKAVQA